MMNAQKDLLHFAGTQDILSRSTEAMAWGGKLSD
jgi:hypothetical protein